MLMILFLVWISVGGGNAGIEITCDPDFENTCKNVYKGITNGGRCFFHGNTTATWNDAWTVCANQGGRLAQVHTSSEMEDLRTLLLSQIGTAWVWLASVRHESPPWDYSKCWEGDTSNSFWYESPTEYNPLLAHSNTWVRTRLNDDCYAREGNATVLWTGFTLFGDYLISTAFYPMCYVSNAAQNYIMVQNTCMTEIPIMSYSSTTVESCASNCDQQHWCRSFNFRTNGACELFTWAAEDKPNSTNTADCFFYSYDP